MLAVRDEMTLERWIAADYFHTSRRGSVVGVWVRGRHVVRLLVRDHETGDAGWREHRAVLRCG